MCDWLASGPAHHSRVAPLDPKPEEGDRINGGAANARIVAVPHEVAYKGRIEHLVQVAIEVVCRDEFLAGLGRQQREQTRFLAHHGASPSQLRPDADGRPRLDGMHPTTRACAVQATRTYIEVRDRATGRSNLRSPPEPRAPDHDGRAGIGYRKGGSP